MNQLNKRKDGSVMHMDETVEGSAIQISRYHVHLNNKSESMMMGFCPFADLLGVSRERVGKSKPDRRALPRVERHEKGPEDDVPSLNQRLPSRGVVQHVWTTTTMGSAHVFLSQFSSIQRFFSLHYHRLHDNLIMKDEEIRKTYLKRLQTDAAANRPWTRMSSTGLLLFLLLTGNGRRWLL
jgi:hypothetical protein